MSGLFGICDFLSGLPNEARHALLLRMGERAVQLSVHRVQKPSARSQVGNGVAMGLCHRGSDPPFPGPEIHVKDGLWLAFAGRLDHRNELDPGHQLGSARPSDAALVAAEYSKLGIDCVNRLNGDWAFALWDESQQRLVLARDATGISSIYWWHGKGQLLFASSMPVLLAAGPVPTRPDPRWIAGLLTAFVDTAHPGGTAFQGVHALPAGHVLIARHDRTEIKRWWRPEELSPFWREGLPELQNRFLTTYQEAVSAVLPSAGQRTEATLSGGLDSGSTVALAAPMLAARGQRLTAYVHTPRFDASSDHPSRNTNEWELALATAQHVGNVDAVSCPGERLSPLQGIHDWLNMAVVPSHAAGNWFWLLDIAKQAASNNAEVLLVAQAGNSAVSYPGSGSLWPRLLRRQWLRAWAELSADRQGTLGAVGTRLVKPVLRPAWHGLKQALEKREPEQIWSDYAFIHPGLAQEVGLMEAMREAGHDPTFGSASPTKTALFRLTLFGGAEGAAAGWNELGRSHGMDIRDPTRDRKLIELCWRLPDELFWAQGQKRGLVRVAMSGRLPANVLRSDRKGLQAADVRQRLQASRTELMSDVERLTRHPVVRQWIDTQRFLQSARAIVDPSMDTSAQNPGLPQHLLRTLAAAEFISRHS